MKTCFLICPIGDDGSVIRQRADDLMELVLQPALEVFDFEVVRADRIPRASLITNDVIQLVQQSQLCVADISDRNPNVFYEVGRRHETGKPLVQLIESGQDIPFDLSGIRTLEYTLGSPRQIKTVIDKIRTFIKVFEDSGYSQPASGASLASIAGSIERMERQLAKLSVFGNPSLSAMPETDSPDLSSMATNPFFSAVLGPAMQMDGLIKAGRVEEATAVLIKSRDRLPPEKFHQYGSWLTMAGVDAARALTMEFLEASAKDGATLSQNELILGLGSLVHYYSSMDREKDGVERLSGLFASLLEHEKGDAEKRAFIYNQMAKLYGGGGDDDSAFIYAQKACQLSPDPAYKRNFDSLSQRLKEKEA